MDRVLKEEAFKRLEPDDGKLSSPVLRGRSEEQSSLCYPAQEKAMNVYSKLQRARVLVQKSNIKKSGLNKFSNYHYYELSDFIPVINEVFDEIGLASCFNINGENAELVVINTDDVTQIVLYSLPLPKNVDIKGASPIQNIGAMSSYMKRYLYLNALEIVESDMVDRAESSKPTIQQVIDKVLPMPQTKTTTTRIESSGRPY